MQDDKEKSVTIVVGNDGITVSHAANVKGGIEGLAKGEQPLACNTPAAIDPPLLSNPTKDIRALTSKAVLCAIEKLSILMEQVQPTVKDLEMFLTLTLKLMDAKEAYEWADAFRAAVLKNPKLMSPNGKSLGPKALETRSQGAILQRIERGDTRTTPKRLIRDMPSDDDAKATG
jgi:hypothetical protein